MPHISKWFCGFLCIIAVNACVEPYDPPLDNEDISLLVVDGFLNATTDTAQVRLTRTLPVKSPDIIPGEQRALVRIEDDQGLIYTLSESGGGFYRGPVPDARPGTSYRVLIRTSNNREYVSEFSNIIQAPPIDSITYHVDNDGVEFLVNAHDSENISRNYRWTFVETYEYKANFNSLFKFEGQEPVFRPLTESIFTCWRSNQSTDILVGSTKHLEESVVSEFPVLFIPKESIKISVKYSLLLQQQALTDEAYNYWSQLEKTTEHLGGLFDPLPSEVQGNLKSISDPSETVIGFFSAGTIEQQRIFLERSDWITGLSGYYRGNPVCALDTVPISELSQVYPPTTLLVDALYSGPALIGYTATPISCADCRTMGGNTTKPAFWE